MFERTSKSAKTEKHTFWKYVIRFMLIFMLCTSVLPSVRADAKPYMKTMKKLKWDLKKGKKYYTKLRIAGVGLKSYTVEMTKYKVSKPDRKGMKTLTYTLRFMPNWAPTPYEVYKIVYSDPAVEDDMYEGYCMNLQPDYFTGFDLEYWEGSPVSIKLGKWKEINKKYYYSKSGDEWYYTNGYTQTTKIRFPKNYKGLCIVVGTTHTLYETWADEEYLDGERVFGKTSYYKKSIKSMHAMRVR